MAERPKSTLQVIFGMQLIWFGALFLSGLAVGIGQMWLIPVFLVGAVALQFLYSARAGRRNRELRWAADHPRGAQLGDRNATAQPRRRGPKKAE